MNYQFIDDRPEKGFNLYRLKQVDKDNNVEYSATRWIKLDDTKNGLNVFPTLTSGTIFIQSNEKTIVELYDLRGIRLFVKQVQNIDQVDLSNYAGGIYLLRNRSDGRSYKIIKR